MKMLNSKNEKLCEKGGFNAVTEFVSGPNELDGNSGKVSK